MKSKTIVLFAFSLFQLTYVLAQINEAGTSNVKINMNDLFFKSTLNSSENQMDLSNISGSPYENEAFVLGRVNQKSTKKSMPYYLRYNIYNDEIQIKMDMNERNTRSLIKKNDIFMVLNQKEYHFLSYTNKKNNLYEGYFILIFKGQNCKLFLRRTKIYKEKQLPKDGYHDPEPAKLVDNQSYYYTEGKVLVPLADSKKNILKQFSGFENKLKNEIKTENLNLRTEEGLKSLFAYYDTLLE